MRSTQINCGKTMPPWREDPKLQSRFHPDFPDDIQVLVHDGGLRTTDKRPELVWVRVIDGCSPWYSGTVLNQPLHLLSVHQDSTIHFVVPQGGEHPLMVTEQYIRERPDWTIEPCDRCGLTELFDEPSKLLKITFPDLDVPEERQLTIMFSTFCGYCGGKLIVSSRTPDAKSEGIQNIDHQTTRTGHILQVSKDAVRKLMRHGWNVYPLEAFGFLLGTANPPCVYAALPTSKTAHWDSHADRWNGLVEKRTVAEEVAALFGLQVVGVYATHETGVDLRPFPADFAAGIVITYSFDWGTNEAGVHSAALHAPGIGRDDWELSRGKRLLPEVNQRRILKAWREHVGPIDYSNNYKTEYPRLYGTLPDKKVRYPPPKKQDRKPVYSPPPSASPHRPPPPDPLNRWNTSQRVAVGAEATLTEEQQTILAAIRSQTTLTFRYIGGSRPGDIRTARPKELFQVAGYPGCYLLADDLDLDEERVFRLDRIDWRT